MHLRSFRGIFAAVFMQDAAATTATTGRLCTEDAGGDGRRRAACSELSTELAMRCLPPPSPSPDHCNQASKVPYRSTVNKPSGIRIRITCCSLSTSQPLALRCVAQAPTVELSSIDCPGELLKSRSRSRFNLLESSKLDAGGWKLA
ncbi:hypothetical protein K456DRAFT_1621508 [Colletotrichum gloeosporioides 23]|nr:hypothetical protein K456DRAFT_1621508 [Colletotrichum gloeosporioides 23]